MNVESSTWTADLYLCNSHELDLEASMKNITDESPLSCQAFTFTMKERFRT